MSQKNFKLIAARQEKNWTQSDACEAVEVPDVRTWQRWELNGVIPTAYYRRKLCTVFDRGLEELGFLTKSAQRDASASRAEETKTSTLLLPGDEEEMDRNRRSLLQQLFTITGAATFLPVTGVEAWERLAQPGNINADTLTQFQKLTEVCWQLSTGNDLAIAESILPTYLPKVTAIAQQSASKYQPAAAHIASQSLQLTSILVAHKLDLTAKITLCRQAVLYAKLARDNNVYVAALIQLAVAYQYAEQPQKALQTYQEALQYKNIAPLLRARVLAEAGEAYARCGGTKTEALQYLGSAYEVYPDRPELDPSFLYADCPYPVLSLYQGIAYMDFNQPKEAYHTFAQVEKLPATIIVPERIRLEVINHKSKAAIALGDLDLSIENIVAGVNGAKALGSQKRYSEAREAYQQMVVRWPTEQAVKDVASLLQA